MIEVTMNLALTQLLILVHAAEVTEDTSEETKGKKSKQKTMTGTSGDLEILIFDIHSGSFVPRTITVDPKTAMTKTPPALGMGPLIDPLGSDYCFIIHDGIIRIISMNTNHVVRDEAGSIPKNQRSKMDASGSLMIAHDFTRIYYVGHNGTQIREAITKNLNNHTHTRELAVVSRLQLAWEEDPRLIRLHTAAAEQRSRGLRWDIADHNVFREIQGMVLEAVTTAIERSEENMQAQKEGKY
jgi:hypothetical protein